VEEVEDVQAMASKIQRPGTVTGVPVDGIPLGETVIGTMMLSMLYL
jgi:hypothetical protein